MDPLSYLQCVNHFEDNNFSYLFTKGYINTTLMFYSNYHGSIFTSASDKDITYNMELAYILVGGAFFIVSLLMMVKK